MRLLFPGLRSLWRRPTFTFLSLNEPGRARLVLAVLTFNFDPCFRLVCLRDTLLPMFRGALQVLGFATVLPFREPVVQRYLRTSLFPVRPATGMAPSNSSLRNIISCPLLICSAFVLSCLLD